VCRIHVGVCVSACVSECASVGVKVCEGPCAWPGPVEGGCYCVPGGVPQAEGLKDGSVMEVLDVFSAGRKEAEEAERLAAEAEARRHGAAGVSPPHGGGSKRIPPPSSSEGVSRSRG